MSLEPAIVNAWDAISGENLENARVRFLADEFSIDIKNKRVLTLSPEIPVEDSKVVLILHYLAQKRAGLPAPTGEWLRLSGLSVAEGFTNAFEKPATDLILRKYGNNPDEIYEVLKKIPGKKINQADAAVVLEVFEGIPVLVQLWRADEEFGAEGSLLFDKTIRRIFCTEDILVLAEMIARAM